VSTRPFLHHCAEPGGRFRFEEAMANRHSHKKLRAEIRARMRRTGESYQRARQSVLARAPVSASALEVDFVTFEFFGAPMTLATTAGGAVNTIAILNAGTEGPWPVPRLSWLLPRGTN
jgi:hypothetical protein